MITRASIGDLSLPWVCFVVRSGHGARSVRWFKMRTEAVSFLKKKLKKKKKVCFVLWGSGCWAYTFVLRRVVEFCRAVRVLTGSCSAFVNLVTRYRFDVDLRLWLR